MQTINLVLLSTILIFNVIMPKVELAQNKINSEEIRKKIENYEPLTKKDVQGNTLYHDATTEENEEAIDIIAEIESSGFWSYLGYKSEKPDINEPNNEGKTALHIAMEKGNVRIIEKLRKKGARIDIADKKGITPVFAVKDPQLIRFLIAENLINKKLNGNNLLSHAICTKNYPMVEAFVKESPNLIYETNHQGKNPIIIAAEQDDVPSLQILQVAGIPLSSQLIHHVTGTKTLEYLLHNGGKIDELDSNGRTPLMNAMITKNHVMAQTYKNHGADLYATDNSGENLLHKIARNGDINGLAMLRNAYQGQDWNRTSNDGSSPLSIAVESGNIDIVGQFINSGASITEIDKNKRTLAHKAATSKNKNMLTELIRNGLPREYFCMPDKNGWTPIHYAIAEDDVEMMQAFTQYGASYSDTTFNRNTLAHVAAQAGSVKVLQYFKQHMPMMLLQRNQNNDTPFIAAAGDGSLDAVNLLFREEDIMNGDNKIAINRAQANNHTHIVNALKTKESDRINARLKLSQRPENIEKIDSAIFALERDLVIEDPWFLMQNGSYRPSTLKIYTLAVLLEKTEAECNQISAAYDKIENAAIQKKLHLKNQLDGIRLEKQLAHIAQENARIAKEQEQARQAEQRRIFANQQRIEQENQRRVQEQQRQENIKKEQAIADEAARLKILSDQNAEPKRIEKENEAKKAQEKKEVELLSQQQALLNKAKAEKIDRENAIKHVNALEKQQAHVPMNLQPSAPPVENVQVAATKTNCAKCNKDLHAAKPLPCVKCKKKIENTCPQCVKEQKGRCVQCLEYQNLGIEKRKGECYMCGEEKRVTPIPCDACKISSDHICDSCLTLWQTKHPSGDCPKVRVHKLNQKLLDAIKAQK
jgi:ankyrin repeat protein